MSEWTLCRWHGEPAALDAALRALGWHGPGESPEGPCDPRVGGVLPAPGEPLRVLDGLAYAAVAAREPLPLPPGLVATGPDLSAALLGSF